MNILDTIVKKTRVRVENLKTEKPLETLIAQAKELPCGDFSFERALCTEDIAFICEIKKASPSKGLIAQDFDYLNIAKEYEQAHAAAISVLTEPYWFLGRDEYLYEISQNVTIPLLRKDFTVDEYQIYEAKILGAAAVLLICSVLDDEKLSNCIKIADTLGLSSLVEAHNEKEVKRALSAGARVIGVNNRDLKTFEVDINNSVTLRKCASPDVIFVSESGIKTPEDINILRQNKVNAVLIGETFMRSSDKKAQLDKLRGRSEN